MFKHQIVLQGIHHITIESRDAAAAHRFYETVLGLHLIKQTVRYDAVDQLHWYFGDAQGSPGTLLSLWLHPAIPEGGVGKGQIATAALSIPLEAVDFWVQRLAALNVLAKYPQQRGETVVIYIEDPDGAGIELIATDRDPRPGISSQPDIPAELGIRGIHHAEIWLSRFDRTAGFLTRHLGFRLLEEQGFRFRYGVGEAPGQFVDLLWGREGAVGIAGAGTIHHLGLTVAGEDELWTLREQLNQAGVAMGPLREQTYYRALTLRDPEGIWYDLATVGPGMTLDEAPEALGQRLQLPIWENWRRAEILQNLPPFPSTETKP